MSERRLNFAQGARQRLAVFFHTHIAGDSPIRQNTFTAILVLTVQIGGAIYIGRDRISWAFIAVIVLTNFLVFYRNEQNRGGVRGAKKATRKVLTRRIVDDLTTGIPAGAASGLLTEQDLKTIRTMILSGIASNVASFFYDFNKTKTYAALIVIDKMKYGEGERECLRVVARDDPSRAAGTTYVDVENYIAYKTIKLKHHHYTGNVQWQYPSLENKPYKSVLSLPLELDGEVIGAVNVDSSRAFHFDGRDLLFQTNLAPYLSLLAMTFKLQGAPYERKLSSNTLAAATEIPTRLPEEGRTL